MVTIIHASHRHSYSWQVAKAICDSLKKLNVTVNIIDLVKEDIRYCCGEQVCQNNDCIYKDDFTSHLYGPLLNSKCVYIVSPTYFDMPPARLKNFIDRSNALLPELENKTTHPIFGTWISGEADIESIECNCRLLSDYATIMGWNIIEEICEKDILDEEKVIEDSRIQKITKLICQKLK